MRITLCLLLLACGSPQPAKAPPATPLAAPADAGITVDAAFIPVDALVCKYKTCIDICCDKDEVCSHGRLGDDTFPKCLRPHRP